MFSRLESGASLGKTSTNKLLQLHYRFNAHVVIWNLTSKRELDIRLYRFEYLAGLRTSKTSGLVHSSSQTILYLVNHRQLWLYF